MPETITWANLRGITHIASDYVEGKPDVISLLGGDWRNESTRENVGNRRRSFENTPQIGSAIRRSYGEMEIPFEVEHNLEALDNPDTLAIVTGQQLGLFGGSLLVFYKALSAIFMARHLENHSDRRVVPVFWMESADADFSEVNRIGFPPDDVFPRRLTYTPRDIVAGRSAKYHIMTSEIEEVRKSIIEWLKPLPKSKSYIDLLNSAYQPNRSMAGAFRELLTGLLGDLGLILIDPLDPAIVQRTELFWDNILESPNGMNRAFSVSSGDVQKQRRPLQVRLREGALPMYLIDKEGIRHRIHGGKDKWRAGNVDKEYTDKQLRRLIENPDIIFSPNVLLRPLLQDWLLPTWIYMGGPSEIAYHAQIGRAYDQLNMPRPLIAPRISATLVERQARRWLDKHNWKVLDALGGLEILLRSDGKAESLDGMFDNGRSHLKGWIDRIGQSADAASINITQELDVAGRKMEYQWNKLQKNVVKKIAERDNSRNIHAEKLQRHLLPDEMLQERHNNILYYLAKYGTKVIQLIDSEKDLFNPKHIVLDLEQEQ